MGYEANETSKKSTTWWIFFVMTLFCGVLRSRAASAHDPPPIPATRIDFDARYLPKSCNDNDNFLAILNNWVTPGTITPDAARSLAVRIRRSAVGGKVVDITLMEADGTTLGEDHKTFASTTECHKVLHDAAKASARLMGAFEKPPPREPLSCPVCPTCPTCAKPTPCPTTPLCPAAPISRIPVATAVPPPMRRMFVGVGFFLGRSLASEWVVAPQASFGFVPLSRVPRLQVEIEGAWAQQTFTKSDAPSAIRGHAIPLFGSLCYAPSVLRLCSGIATTLFEANRAHAAQRNDDLGIALGATLRLGTEFVLAHPVSIRLDAYTVLHVWPRSFGGAFDALEALKPFAIGIAALGVWSRT